MEPSFWSWEKWSRHTSTATDQPCRNGAQLLELGKGSTRCHRPGTRPCRNGAQLLELGKAIEVQTYFVQDPRPQWSPAFGAGKRALTEEVVTEAIQPQWSPAFGAGKSFHRQSQRVQVSTAAMEPSFWSWEKEPQHAIPSRYRNGRNGAQLLELGKVGNYAAAAQEIQAAMEPSFWSWEKTDGRMDLMLGRGRNGAQLLELGKAGRRRRFLRPSGPRRNGAQLLELGKELAIFSPTDYQCCTSLRAAEVLGQTSRVVAP